MKIRNTKALSKKIKSAREGFVRFELKNYMLCAKNWKRDSQFGRKAEDIIYNELTDDGYTVLKITEWKDLGEDEKTYTSQERVGKAREQKFKPDAIVIAPNFRSMFFADSKGKSSKAYLGWVNKRDYDKYWKGSTELDMRMRIYFYIEETNEIWTHDVRDPNMEPHFKIKPQPDAEVYAISQKELSLYRELVN